MLPHLSLSFTTPGWSLLRTIQLGLWLLVLGAAAFSFWAWTDSLALQDEALRHEQAAERLRADTKTFLARAREAGFALTEERAKTLPREVAFANQLLEKRAFSWTRFLSDLESTVPSRTSIASVSLSFSGTTITVAGTALTLKDVTAFVEELERHPVFEKVVLSEHHTAELRPKDSKGRPESSAPGTPVVTFTLTVTYNPTS